MEAAVAMLREALGGSEEEDDMAPTRSDFG